MTHSFTFEWNGKNIVFYLWRGPEREDRVSDGPTISDNLCKLPKSKHNHNECTT